MLVELAILRIYEFTIEESNVRAFESRWFAFPIAKSQIRKIAKSPQTIFLTGGSGFVGSAVIDELLARGHSINALLNHGQIRSHESIRIIRGDLFNAAALDEGLRDADAAIHLVGIIIENKAKGVTFEHMHVDGTRAIIDAVKRSRVTRYIHMSALGTRPDAVSNYHKTKYAAEQIVQTLSPLSACDERSRVVLGERRKCRLVENAVALLATSESADFI